MTQVIYILFLSLLGVCQTHQLEHEFHLSKCDIHYSAEESALQISLRIFIDDLEEAIAKVLKEENLKLCTSKEAANADSILTKYLAETFLISVDDKMYEIEFVGKEVSEDLLAVWCYFEVVNVVPQNNIQVENKILIETFDDQSNVVAMKYSKDKKEHFLLQKGKTLGTLELN